MEMARTEKDVKIFRGRVWRCEKHNRLFSARTACVDCWKPATYDRKFWQPILHTAENLANLLQVEVTVTVDGTIVIGDVDDDRISCSFQPWTEED